MTGLLTTAGEVVAGGHYRFYPNEMKGVERKPGRRRPKVVRRPKAWKGVYVPES